jgi:ribosomal-protein-alanine acetyltransferase
MIFGVARADDVEALVSIDSASPQAWTPAAFLAEMDHDPKTLFVLRSGERVVAFVVARFQIPEMDIVNLAVAGDLRRRGLGRFLLRSLLDHVASSGVRTVFLEVREGNREAQGLYASLGFEPTQRRRGFYNEPTEDAMLMRLDIEPEDEVEGPGNAC